MELRVLNYFLAIAREQSIVHAAESLHLSQPTLSTQIKGLEEELGKQLLIRVNKGIPQNHSHRRRDDPQEAGGRNPGSGQKDRKRDHYE